MENSGLRISYETADAITLDNLKDAIAYLQRELEEHEEGQWLHPEDVVKNKQLIKAMDEIIAYFGG